MSDLLKGRKVIITGGASGMGEGLVRAFPSLGAKVVSLDLTAEAGSLIAREAGARFIACDVSRKDSVDEGFSEAVKHLGGLDVLIHAAGVAPGGAAEDIAVDTWTKVMSINATGTFLTNQAAFNHLRESGGRIINFASAAGVQGLANKAAYSASKGAVVAWTRTVAQEWAKYDITVNAIAPAIWTPMYDKTRASMTPEQLDAHDKHMLQAVPIGGRLGDVDRDFVPVLAFLSGEGSRFMTGQVFPVDGGTLMMR
ncbi:SDR family NAD(P)-dependent oxidoreductase [Rhodococcus globerulus]|nr:SDR family NAD(P)-dependent oxidoreductase [Rhodococcus globerulus]NMD61319.1 SDR family oxidoreductase [Nocardia globerula]PVX67129.1 NAD(P)-dependent dehydrogenase (short-subunit alcohol dehydrogenase family) [Rhodococcus globerulus]